ncbi:MAG: phenylacetate--CoA ligase family protein, partial [Methanomicrobiales archaeon]|nr:phenylacetate--CoA ligase family protein [Methanomicrobiales archaeon]
MIILIKTMGIILFWVPSTSIMIISLLPYYFGFLKQYLFLKKSQTWGKEKLEQYQTQKLRELINHVYQNVPYYRRIFDERNLKPDDIKNISDLKKLPLLTKDIIRDNFPDFIATNYSHNQREYVTTGGSSGIPLGFYYEKGVSRMTELAFMKTQWDRVGYHFFDKCVILRGNVVTTASEGKFWEKLLFGRWLVLSSYHMTDENLSQYVEAIRAFNPKFIQAYPSAITLLAKYMEKNKIPPFSGLKAILCGSENIFSWQRE